MNDDSVDLDTLIEYIKKEFQPGKKPSVAKLRNIMSLYNHDKNEWKVYQSFQLGEYTRNVVFVNTYFSLYLLCWDPWSKTEIHGHTGSDCVMKIVQGKLKEYLYYRVKQPILGTQMRREESLYSKGDDAFINDQIGLHKISNETSERASSLHLYFPPLYLKK